MRKQQLGLQPAIVSASILLGQKLKQPRAPAPGLAAEPHDVSIGHAALQRLALLDQPLHLLWR